MKYCFFCFDDSGLHLQGYSNSIPYDETLSKMPETQSAKKRRVRNGNSRRILDSGWNDDFGCYFVPLRFGEVIQEDRLYVDRHSDFGDPGTPAGNPRWLNIDSHGDPGDPGTPARNLRYVDRHGDLSFFLFSWWSKTKTRSLPWNTAPHARREISLIVFLICKHGHLNPRWDTLLWRKVFFWFFHFVLIFLVWPALAKSSWSPLHNFISYS